ncbi:MAG TPA: glycosyltransferase family 2 protein, partial [Candidatus Saccharimonadales bacterium]|nr:glycosyltransferase family 2 protein [Candidatus Saccharimonadales bacterium]
MIRGQKISVVIPCYNEEDGVRHVLTGMPGYVDEVVVVDNNSTDRTGEVARSLGARVVFEPRPGYGAAYKAGLPAATGDIIATLDGDGSYPSDAIQPLAEHLVDRELDFISGCRFPLADPKAMPFANQVGNNLLTLAMFVLFGRPVKDSQSGMWVFRRAVLKDLRLTSDGMPLSEEIKIEALRRGLRFEEVHIRYLVRIGDVKLRKWRDGWENLMFLVRKRFG